MAQRFFYPITQPRVALSIYVCITDRCVVNGTLRNLADISAYILNGSQADLSGNSRTGFFRSDYGSTANMKNFTADTAYCIADNGSSLDITVTRYFDGTAKNGSTINVYGNPAERIQDIQGGSHIHFR